MKPEGRYVIEKRRSDNTYDIFYKQGKKVDFVSNHDTYEEAKNELSPASEEDIGNFNDFFNKLFDKK